MKFNCGLTFFERLIEQQKHWITWYAWLPTRVAPGDCRWLEVIERKRDIHLTWEYRAIDEWHH